MNTQTPETLVYAHVFQTAGLGVAPYAYVEMIVLPASSLSALNPEGYKNEMRYAYSRAAAYGVSLGSCEFCGQCLRYNAVIRDAKNDHFVVGCDCVNKTDDSELITATEAARREIERQKKEAAAQIRQAARVAARCEKEETEKQNNGGLTLEEIRTAAHVANRARLESFAAEVNAPILSILNSAPYSGEFVYSMIAKMEGGESFFELPPNCQRIISEIYAKTVTGKTLRNKATIAAQDEFNARIDSLEEAATAAEVLFETTRKAIESAYWTAKKGNGVFIAPATLPGFSEE